MKILQISPSFSLETEGIRNLLLNYAELRYLSQETKNPLHKPVKTKKE